MEGPDRISVEQVELLDPGQGMAVVRIVAALACQTDVIQRRTGGGLSEPHIRGHAGVGVVEGVGPGTSRVRPGDRVLIPTRPQCANCFWCVAGQAEHCESTTRPGAYAARRQGGQLLRGSARVGAFAEFALVSQSQVVAIDSSISDDELVTLGCGGAAGLGNALLTAPPVPGGSALVMGAGVFGLATVQGARIAGADTIIAIDPVASRRQKALALGATVALDPDDAPSVAAVKGLTGGRGVDVGYDCVGTASALSDVFKATRIGGDVVCGGFGSRDDVVVFGYNELGMRGRRVLSSQFGSVNILRDIPRFVRLVEGGQFDARSLIDGHFPLERLNEALDLQSELEILGAVIQPTTAGS